MSHKRRRHRHQEWLAFLRKIEREVPTEFDVHLICDNSSTHKQPKCSLGSKIILGFICISPQLPLPGPIWSNASSEKITRKVIRCGSFRSVGALVADIFVFLHHHNLNPTPYRWTADPRRTPEKIDRAWEGMLEAIYNPYLWDITLETRRLSRAFSACF